MAQRNGKKQQPRDNLSLDLFVKKKVELAPSSSVEELNYNDETTGAVEPPRQQRLPSELATVSFSSNHPSSRHSDLDSTGFEIVGENQSTPSRKALRRTTSLTSSPSQYTTSNAVFTKQSATPVRTTSHSFSEPHVSWDISPQITDQTNSIASQLDIASNNSYYSAQAGSDSDRVNTDLNAPVRDPETDLLTKFKSLQQSYSSLDPKRKLIRTESAAAILKTPTKTSTSQNFGRMAQLYSPEYLRRSMPSFQTSKADSTSQPLHSFNQHPDSLSSINKPKRLESDGFTPTTRKRKSLIRHSTSPALNTSQGDKMARLLSLADKISSEKLPVIPRTRSNSGETLKEPSHSKDELSKSESCNDDSEDALFNDAFDSDTLLKDDIFDGEDELNSPPRITAPSQSLLPITPLSVKIAQGTVKPINTEHLFTPLARPEESKPAQQEPSKPPKDIISSDLDEFFNDDDLLGDYMNDLNDFSSSPAKPTTKTENTKQPSDFDEDLFDTDIEFNSDLEDESLLQEIDRMYSTGPSDQSAPTARSSKRAVSETTLIDPPLGQSGFKDFRTERLQRTRTSTIEAVPLKTIVTNPKVHRYLVNKIAEQQYLSTSERGVQTLLDEIQLTVTNHDEQEMYIKLRDNWLDCVPVVQNIIHIIGDYKDRPQECIVVNNEDNLMVVQPDLLITCTTVSEGFFCKRKLVLRDRLKSGSETNIHMIYGSIIHEIFQFCVSANVFTSEFINEKIDILVEAFLEELYLCDVDPSTATEYLHTKIPKICEWGNTFISPSPKPFSFVDEHRSRARRLMSVSNIIDVEEEVWSPTYGLKGRIDVTVETCLQDAVREWKFLSPLEIKTSKNTRAIGHRAQTTLYTLLLSDRYEINIKYGVLVYSETGETIRIPEFASEVRDLLIARNQIAQAMGERDDLPPMIENDYRCRICERLDACMTFKCADNNASITPKQVESMESPGILVEYISSVGHITPAQTTFFKHWNQLLTNEEQEMKGHLKELWTMTSKSREAIGRCFSNVKVQGPPEEVHLSEIISKYTYILERNDPIEDGPFKYHESHLSPGDPIIVSDESGHVFLASGILVNVTRSAVTITVNRRLTDTLQKQAGFDEESNQVFHSLMHLTWEASNTQSRENGGGAVSTIFRIDKDEFGQAMSVARNNLVQLMLQKHDHNQLHSIVDLAAPRFLFQPSQHWYLPTESRYKLNKDQRAAITKVLTAQDYALILGMPGTGKTTTIAAIIEILVSQKKTVLLASYTHSAVDTILRKVKDSGIDILRLGRPSLVDPEVRQFTVGAERTPRTREQIEQVYMNPPVVASTCLGISHWLFKRRTFDYCIVDEASQVTLPTCLGPIRYANKFVLVGDHFQLSPLVRNLEAQEGGLDISLFKRLNDHHPESVVNLEHQYRMCKDIMMVSNRLIYDGRLKCGSEEIANQILQIPNKGAIAGWKTKSCIRENDWVEWVLTER